MMTKITLMVEVCATLLCAGTALATPTPQENCDKARVTAWKTYVSCVDTVVAKDASCMPTSSCPASFNEFAAFAKCRHTYFKQWTLFQGKASLAASSCIGTRFANNGTTVTDDLSGLVWEKKTGVVGAFPNLADVHDVNTFFTWSTGSNNEDGTAYTAFLESVNSAGFAGANGWRLPTLAELQSVLLDFACTGVGGGPTCTCGSNPCIDGTFGPTKTFLYWTATSYAPPPSNGAWVVYPEAGGVFPDNSENGQCVRAVRGGL